jgi:hypothetical protein
MSFALVLAWISRTNNDDIELKAALEQLVFDLARNGVEADIRLCTDVFGRSSGHFVRNERDEEDSDERQPRSVGHVARSQI